MNTTTRTAEKIGLVALPVTLLVLLVVSLAEPSYTQPLFVHTAYYFLMATVLCWAGTHVHAARGLQRGTVLAWVKENWPGLALALVVTVIAALAVPPALRMLSDEANLVGTSKNLFASQTATFTVSGKNYYDSYWDVDVAIDQRPALFPFLVSLVHVVCGYSYRNVFLFNLMMLPVFVVVAYRLAKSLGGETVAIVTSLLVAAHPITLLAVRSGGFDFFALLFALLVLKSLSDYLGKPSPARLAMLWMNACMLAEIRYESVLFLVPLVALLFAFRAVTWTLLRPYAFIYALTPAYLLPRMWQALLVGSVPRQDPGTVAFSIHNFFPNVYEYFAPILSPWHSYPAHARVVLALGIVGCALGLRTLARPWFSSAEQPRPKFPAFVVAWLVLQTIILFAYAWGHAQSPAAARLFIAMDTFFAFAAAFGLTRLLRRFGSFVAIMLAVAILVVHVPTASRQRMLNRMTQTRESATAWRFFESLHEKRILIVAARPNLYTIMDYGAMSFAAAKNDPFLFEAWGRRLFYDVYLVQQISLATQQPLPGYDLWADRKRETMLEFQNDADVLIRISRLAR